MKQILGTTGLALAIVVSTPGLRAAQVGFEWIPGATGGYSTFSTSGGQSTTRFTGINASGAIAGWDLTSIFSYDNGTINRLQARGRGDSVGINDLGQVVGSDVPGCHSCGFLYSAGIYTLVSVPGALVTVPTGINNSGEITGYYSTNSEIGFIDRGGTYTTLSVPGSILTLPLGINNAGDIVGLYEIGNSLDDFLYDGNAFTLFTDPNYQFFGINDAGDIVGSYAPLRSGFVYRNGIYQYLTVPGARATGAFGINEQGDVVGVADFELPTPETATSGMLGAGLAALLARGIRRSRRSRLPAASNPDRPESPATARI